MKIASETTPATGTDRNGTNDRPARFGTPDLVALMLALVLPLLAVAILLIAAAPGSTYQGRMIVRMHGVETTQDAVLRITAAGAIPLRSLPFIDGWVISAPAGSVPRLREAGAGLMLRDLGIDALYAGCLASATAPARTPVTSIAR